MSASAHPTEAPRVATRAARLGVVTACMLGSVLGGAASAAERCEYRQLVMGVEARLVLYADDAEHGRRAAAAVFAQLDALDAVLSDWRDDSELMQLCARAGDGPVEVSAELAFVLERAKALAELTGGAFDPTVGPLVQLWREARDAGDWPAADAWRAARAATGHHLMEACFESGSADLAVPGMRLDLGGIGKGFAADEALVTLAEHGITSALVDIGGDLVVGDAPPERAGWVVQAGCGEGGQGGTRLSLVNQAVATTGDTAQPLELGGVTLTHLVDPRSGQLLPAGLCCTVIAPDGATADALASAARVLGARAARRVFADLPGVRLITEDPLSVPAFDGESLDGWTTVGGRYDGSAPWRVEDGAIVGTTGPAGEGGLIYTERSYTSSVISLECKLDEPFDSGVFVRMAPEGRGAQITLDVRPGGEVGAVYADGFLQHDTESKALWKRGQWNHVEVETSGFDMHLRAWLNGTLITDYRLPAGTAGFAPRGLIGLQVHGSAADHGRTVRFRDIRVRELPVLGEGAWLRPGWRPLVSAAMPDDASRALFETMDGRAPDEYGFDGGVLSIPSTPGADIRTRADFTDFIMRLDFQIVRGANGGLFLRSGRDGGNPSYTGAEVQIIDDHGWADVHGFELQPTQECGSLYGAVPAGLDVLRPAGQWNTYELLYQGDRLAVALNGVTLYDVRTHELAADPPFAERLPTGFLGLQRYAAPNVEGDVAIRVREWWLREL